MLKIIVILTFCFSFILFSQENESNANKSTKKEYATFSSMGLNYLNSHNNSDAFAGFDFLLRKSIDDFAFGIEGRGIFGFENTKSYQFTTLGPQVGYYIFGNSETNLKIIISATSGFATANRGNITYYGTCVSSGLDIIYKYYGLHFGAISINTNLYSNIFRHISLRIWF
jgi:hypothetical protein